MGARPLVVVLPGIGGSVLARPGDPGDVVWDMGKRDITGLAWRPSGLGLDRFPHLDPVGLTRSTKLVGFTIVPGYEGLLDALSRLGRVDDGSPGRRDPSADIVAVPYDFRRSILDAADVLDQVVGERLGNVPASDRAGRVVIIAHSLGGLVARAWMALTEAKPGQERWRWCRALVTVGTPHRGAPKALDQLVNGVGVGALRLSGPAQMLRGWPSVRELLPRYPAVRDTRVQSLEEPGATLYPHDLPLPWLTAGAREAYDLHLALEQAWDAVPQKGPETVACIGWSHPTPDAGYWDGQRLVVTKKTPDWLGLSGREADLGDGTVPAVSGLPTQFDYHVSSPVRLRDRHVPMAASHVVADLVKRYLNLAAPTAAHGDQDAERPPSIGLDLDDLHPTGHPLPMRAIFKQLPDGVDPADLRVTARLQPAAGTVPGMVPVTASMAAPMVWDPAHGEFAVDLPAPAPGLYRARVIAREIPQVGDLEASDVIAVTSPDQVETEAEYGTEVGGQVGDHGG